MDVSTSDPAGQRIVVDVALVPSVIADASTGDTTPNARAARARTIYIVIDVIRATTTMCVQLARGCQRVYVAGSIEGARAAARALAAEQAPPRPLLAGESGGVAPVGFDHGNSPAEFAGLDLTGRTIVFATTNGTRALHAAEGGAVVLAGSLRNAAAVAHAAVQSALRVGDGAAAARAHSGGADRSAAAAMDSRAASRARGGEASEASVGPRGVVRVAIGLVCAGRERRPAYDDTICAGYILRRLHAELAERGVAYSDGEGARIAAATAAAAERSGLREALAQSDAARAIEVVGLAGDLDWCAAVDVDHVVPMVAGHHAGSELLIVEPWSGAFQSSTT